jgi:hypothetical protein
LANYILPLLAPHIKYWSTPKRAARVATKVLIDASGQTGRSATAVSVAAVP